MASGVISLGTKNNLRGQIVWTSVSNGSSANTSTVTAELQARKTSNTTIATEGKWTGSLNIGGTTKNISSTIKAVGSSAWKTLLTFSVTVAHAADGTGSCYLYGKIKGPTGTTLAGYSVSGSETVTLDSIPRFATITSAPNFNDESNPVLKYSNPAGDAVSSLQACISLDGSNDDIAYQDISKAGTSHTFTLTAAERPILRRATTGSNSRSVKFKVKTVLGSSTEEAVASSTLSIKDPNPKLTPTIVDTNTATVQLTGDSSILVRYYSNAAVTIGAVAQKEATLTSQKVTCGSKSLTSDGTINAVESGTFTFVVTDSRKNTVTKTVKPSADGTITAFVNYAKPTCVLSNNIPDAEGAMTVKATGNYFNGSFGAKSNSLKVYYRYKVSGGSYGEWFEMSVASSNNTYTATAALTGLDYQTAYVFQTYAKDELATVYSAEKTVKAEPVFDWGNDDFQFHVPVFDQFGTEMTNGVSKYGNIDPNTTLDPLILTYHANGPKGADWYFYIHTMFDHNKKTSKPRCQIALPYGTGGAMYWRRYYDSAWSTWHQLADATDIANHRLKTFYSIAQFGMSGQPTTDEVLAAMPVMSCLIIGNRRGNDNNISDAPTAYCSIVLFKDQYTYGQGFATKVNSTTKETYVFDWYKGGSYNSWTLTNYTTAKPIWENASPTSSYGATTFPSIKKDLSPYRFILVHFKTTASADHYAGSVLVPVDNSGSGNTSDTAKGFTHFQYKPASANHYDRYVRASTTEIVISTGRTITSFSDTTWSVDNSLLIPIAIYGII